MTGKAQLFVTSRSHLRLDADFDSLTKIDVAATEADLSSYLSDGLNKHRSFRRVLRDASAAGDLALLQDILDSLIEAANGMYEVH